MHNSPKKDFIALAIHKLKTPISSVRLCLEMLLEGDFGPLNEEQKRIIERACEKNNMLVYLVNDLINVAKLEERHSYNLKPTGLDEVVGRSIDFEKEQIDKKSITITIEKKEGKLPKVNIDPEEMFLAVQNILDNAIKYSNVGGNIVIYVGQNKNNIELNIKDFGIGISEEEKGRLFTEFFRAENAKEMQAMGSGLGLFIAKNIIEGHGGKIWFESKEGKGTTFFITLPYSL